MTDDKPDRNLVAAWCFAALALAGWLGPWCGLAAHRSPVLWPVLGPLCSALAGLTLPCAAAACVFAHRARRQAPPASPVRRQAAPLVWIGWLIAAYLVVTLGWALLFSPDIGLLTR